MFCRPNGSVGGHSIVALEWTAGEKVDLALASEQYTLEM